MTRRAAPVADHRDAERCARRPTTAPSDRAARRERTILGDDCIIVDEHWCAPRGSNPDTTDQESDALPLGPGAHGRNGRNRTGDSPARGERVITTPRLCGCGGRTCTAA